MKLYNDDLSPFAARCRIQIYAKALDIAFAEVPGGLGSDAWRRLNPIGKVPALDVDGVIVPESEVICEYLEDAHPATPLRPAAPLDRSRARFVSRFLDLYLIPPLTALFGQMNPKTRDERLVDERLRELALRLDQMETILAGSSYAVGDSLTLADCALAPFTFFLVRVVPMLGGADPLASRPRLAKAWASQQQHPAVARVLGEMKVALAAMMKTGLAGHADA